MIRGYEEIKLANVAKFRERRAQMLAELGSMQEASTTRGALA